MKKVITAIISSVLCMILVVQSLPMYAYADTLDAETASEEYDPTAFNPEDIVTEEEEKVFILGEDESQRDETTKVFRMSDGSYTAAVYPIQVHYEEDGEMKEIDNTLQTVDGDRFETKAGPVKISLPSSITADNAVEYSDDEHSVMFKLDTEKASKGTRKAKEKKAKQLEKLGEAIAMEVLTDEEFEESYGVAKSESKYAENVESAIEERDQLMMTSDKIGSEITYRAVFEDVDLRYSVTGTTLKEEIILNSAAGIQKKYEFIIGSDTLTPVLAEDGSVQLCNSEGNAVFMINAPYMYDAAGELSEDIKVNLKKNSDGTYTYTLKPDKKWLEDDARVYPIVIDPPISESDTTTVKDTTGYFATSGAHDPNTIFIGQKNGTVETQGMLYSDVPYVITAGTTKIIKAELMLWGCGGSIASSGLQINAYRITSDWNTSGVKEDSVIFLGTNGRANYSDVLDYVNVTSATSNEIYTWDITEAADEWLAGTNPNYGIALRANSVTSGVNNHAQFVDSTKFYNGANSATAYQCPQFIYTYRDLRGVEDYWSITSMSAGRFGSIGVNNYNGNPVMTQPLVSSTGNNMPVSVSLIYSYNSTDDGGAGLGPWRTNYHMKIETCDHTYKIGDTVVATYKYVFIDSDGTKHYLKQEGNEHKDEDGLGLTMTVLTGETDYKYQIETKDKTKYKFDHAGRMNRIIDSNGNFNHVYFAPSENNSREEILSIVEGSDMSGTRRETKFTYETDGDVVIISPEGNSATLNYLDANNRTLTAIYYDDYDTSNEAGSGAVNFTYESGTYFPSTITDGYGHVTTITNTMSYGVRRVASISWGTSTSTLQKYSFTYNVNSTKVTDIDGRAASYQFNNYGQTIGVVDHTTSWGQNYEYGKQNGQNKGYENKLTLASKTIAPSVNLAIGGSFSAAANVSRYSVYPSITGFTVEQSTGTYNSSSGSMRIIKGASATSASFVYQSISNLETGNYTLSMYVSTNGTELTGTGAYAQVSIYNSDGYRDGNHSVFFTKSNSGEWVRLQTTITLEESDTYVDVGVGFKGDTYGTIYVDDLQFEKNVIGGSPADNLSGAGSYNMLGYANLYPIQGWSNSGFSVATVPSDAPNAVQTAVKTTGKASKYIALGQTVYVTGGAKDDVFIAGGWMKANSVPLENDTNKTNSPMVGVYVTFYNGDNKVGATQVIEANTAVKEWQYLLLKAIAPATYTKVLYAFIYAYTPGEVYFSSPFLYREPYGQSYTYDENGNIISSTDAADTMATFAYQDNALCSSISPTGSRYIYTNDEDTNNLMQAYSNAGQKVDFTYNESGDALSMSISDAKYITGFGNTATVSCYIVNAKTGRAITAYGTGTGDGQGTAIAQFRRWSQQRWWLYPLSSGIFTIRSAEDTTKTLRTNRVNSSFANHELNSVATDVVPEVIYKFKFVSNEDGTYRILTGESGYTNCLTMSDDDYEKGYYKLIANEPYDDDDLADKWYLVSTTTTLKITTSATYSADGSQLLTSTDQAGNVINYSYDSKSGLLMSVRDPNGGVTSYTYDEMRRTESVASGTSNVAYEYSGDKLLKIIVDDGAVVYEFNYDKYGRSAGVYIVEGDNYRALAIYIYSGRNLWMQSYGNGETIRYTYDSLDRVIKKEYIKNGGMYEYFYDCNGNLYKTIDGLTGTQEVIEYDLAGRVVGTYFTDTTGKEILAYASTRYYDKKGTVETQNVAVYDDKNKVYRTTAYEYIYGKIENGQNPDALYEMAAGGRNFTYTYDTLGRLTSRSLSLTTAVNETYTYQSNGTNTTTLVKTHKDMLGATHTYTYDKNGNIEFDVITDSTGTKYKSYLYDSHNRLKRYNDSALNLTVLYTYDDRGNILNYTTYEYSAYDNALNTSTAQVYSYAYGDSTWADLLTTIFGETITYDKIGNPLNWTNGRTLTWTRGRNLNSVTDGTTTTNYTYNSDGLRTKKVTGSKTTEYYVVGGTYVGEKTTINGTTYMISYVYDENGAPAGLNIDGSACYFAKNLQGDIIAILSYDGTVLAKYEYDAWGNIASIKDRYGNTVTSETHIAMLNPFRYRGYMYDSETGLYYVSSRYYDPEIGRWINADSVIAGVGGEIQGYNQFAYCFNNPVMYIDSLGTWGFFQAFCKGVNKFSEIILAGVKSTSCEVGVGFGYGGEAEANIGVASASAGVLAKYDVLSIQSDDGLVTIGEKVEASLGGSVGLIGDIISIDSSVGCSVSHSFSKDCTCDDTFLNSTIEEIEACPAGKVESIEPSTTIGIGVQAYCFVGGTISMSFDYEYFFEQLIPIFTEENE